MAVLEDLTEEECYLLAILTDHSGLDLAEFAWYDPDDTTGTWRAWPFQWKWFRSDAPLQIDQCARSVGKTTSITLRMFAFPFLFPGQEAVVTAPELVHLEPLTNLIERKFYDSRLGREMLPRGRSAVTHRPFMMNFVNGSRIIGRIPQRDGKGVKGIHPIWLELDEAQDFPEAGWTELIETLKRGHDGAVWRAHGVTRGIRDKFYEYTQETPDNQWKVHRYCLPSDTMVYTTAGPVPIEEIAVGTEVFSISEQGDLTENSVTALIDNGVQSTWRVKAKGGFELVSTLNHPYLVLRRDGTRKTRRELAFEWVDAADVRPGDVIVCVSELPSTGLGLPKVEEVEQSFNVPSPMRCVPDWVWRASRGAQMAFLAGYMMGDGSLSRQKKGQDAWQIGTSSKRMAKELRALCHYLGIRASALDENRHVMGGISTGPQYRFYAYPQPSWFRQVPSSYSVHGLSLGKNFVGRTVVASEATGDSVRTWDITVGDSHNFIAEGVVVHNTAMHRPNWTDQERQEKIQQYKTRDNPDYRRNVLGLHGDATNPLFVLHRLMKCVDEDLSSDYNADVYRQIRISTEMLNDRGKKHNIVEFLECPPAHRGFAAYWCGMDCGFTKDPSEILVFGEEQKGGKTTIRLISRIHLERVEAPIQAEVVSWIFDIYNPRRFAMDKTGNGLPLFQDLQHHHPDVAEQITGYNFSEKILVDFDEAMLALVKDGDDEVKEAGITRSVLEYSTDKLRELVDKEQIHLPWDTELIGEFQGQTWTYSKSSMDIYGRPRRVFSQGTFHGLDAARMAALGFSNYKLEEMMRLKAQADSRPVLDFVVDIGGGW